MPITIFSRIPSAAGKFSSPPLRGYLVDADLHSEDERVRLADLLTDPLVEWSRMDRLNAESREHDDWRKLTVLLKPGVMDAVAESVTAVAHDLGLAVHAVRTFRRYQVTDVALNAERDLLARKVLANDAIEQIIEGPLPDGPLAAGRPYQFRKIVVPICELDDAALEKLSREGQLVLTLDEMRTIRDDFREQGRDPTDVELETLAQTWSEHCSHKTLKGRVECGDRTYENLLKETIFGATQEVRKQLADDDWCVSVFVDNAGIVKFDEDHHVCFKVETHNRPSAIEPYGGANTGLGGVIRDVLGVGLGAKPIANTDVFCFAPPNTPPESLPPGVLHPRKVMQGVVAGVRDYGNRMGIPTVNGAVLFDDRYLANPLVFCGTVGADAGRLRKQGGAGRRPDRRRRRAHRAGWHSRRDVFVTRVERRIGDRERRSRADRQRHRREKSDGRFAPGPRPTIVPGRDRLRRRRVQLGRRRNGRRIRGRCASGPGAAEIRGPVVHRDLDFGGSRADGVGRSAGELVGFGKTLHGRRR